MESSWTRGPACVPCVGRWIFITGPPGSPPSAMLLGLHTYGQLAAVSVCAFRTAADIDHYSLALPGHLCLLWIYIFGSCLLPVFIWIVCFLTRLELYLLDVNFVRYLVDTPTPPPPAYSLSLQPLNSLLQGFLGGAVVKNLCQSSRHNSCLANLMDRGAWRAVQSMGLKESDTTRS